MVANIIKELEKMKKVLFVALFMSIFLIKVCMAFSYGIQPMYFEADISNGNGYREIAILNTNKLEKGRYKISISPGSDKEKDISNYIEIYPKVLNVAPDSAGLVKIYANVPTPMDRDEYSFIFNIVPIVIPTLNDKNEKISGVISSPISFALEMYGHYGEETQADIEKKVLLKNFTIYEKVNKEGKTEVWAKGTLENNMFYGFVPAIRTESQGGSKIQIQELRKIRKNGDKISFDYKLNGSFTKKSDVYVVSIYDLINYKPLKEIILEK